MADAPTRAERMRERLAERRASHMRRGRLYRVVFALAGATVTLAGGIGQFFVAVLVGVAVGPEAVDGRRVRAGTLLG